MIIGNNSIYKKQSICNYGLTQHQKFDIGRYSHISVDIGHQGQYIFLSKMRKLKIFTDENFQGSQQVFYGNDHLIHITQNFKSFILSEMEIPVVLCIQLIKPIDKSILFDPSYHHLNQYSKQTLWFPCGVFEDPVKYGFAYSNNSRINAFNDQKYQIQPFQYGFQIVPIEWESDAVINIQNQTPLHIYSELKYKSVQFPSFYEVTLSNKNLKMHIKPQKNEDQYIVILGPVKDLKPMGDKYIVEVLEKRLDDKIFNEILSVNICNKETQTVCGKTILIIILIVIIMSIMHLSILSITKNEVTTLSIPLVK